MSVLRRLFIILFMSMLLLQTSDAQQMREVWLSMPDSLVGYLNKSKRIEAMDYRDMGLKLDVRNLLNGNTLVDTLTADFISVKLTPSSLLQMKLLPREADTLVCVVKTVFGPAADSSMEFFTTSWQRISPQPFAEGANPYSKPVSYFVVRPDTMSVERFAELSAQFEPVLLRVEMPVSGAEMSVQIEEALPLPSSLSESLKAIIKRRNFKWDGQKFIEC